MCVFISMLQTKGKEHNVPDTCPIKFLSRSDKLNCTEEYCFHYEIRRVLLADPSFCLLNPLDHKIL